MRLETEPAVTYAVGDVHGCLDQLRALETLIVADAAGIDGEKLIVMLGDYVDRGPASAQVIDHLLAPPPEGFIRICLGGNHEAAMLAFLSGEDADGDWLGFGSEATLASYGMGLNEFTGSATEIRRAALPLVPAEHREFLMAQPVLVETPHHIFAHAGVRPGVALEAQTDEDLLWFRDGFAADYGEFGKVVVHGHTPLREPFVSAHRIDVDTMAFATGRLTAVRLMAGKAPAFLATGRGN
ncbi:MAG: metallophosphoesterase family protein [Devosia sp.]